MTVMPPRPAAVARAQIVSSSAGTFTVNGVPMGEQLAGILEIPGSGDIRAVALFAH
jgi:hypothetical protein